jgi:hypothetical protein
VTDSLAALLVSSAGQLCWSALLVSSAGQLCWSAQLFCSCAAKGGKLSAYPLRTASLSNRKEGRKRGKKKRNYALRHEYKWNSETGWTSQFARFPPKRPVSGQLENENRSLHSFFFRVGFHVERRTFRNMLCNP